MPGICADISFDIRYSTFPSLCWRCCPILAHPSCDLIGSVNALFITEPDSKHLLAFRGTLLRLEKEEYFASYELFVYNPS